MTFSALDSPILGPLFASAAMRAIFSDEARIQGFLKAEEALARAEADFGVVPDTLAPAIAAIKPANFDMEELARGAMLTGVPVIPFVSALQNILPPDLRGHVHRGATTQDIVDTGLVLQMRDAFALLEKDLLELLEALEALAQRYARTPCTGRTYGQHAAPVTFGFKAAIWLSGIANAASGLPELKAKVLLASLGGPVGTLASQGERGPAIAKAYAEYLQLGNAPISWHTDRTAIAMTGAWLGLLVGAMAKMGGDIIQLATTDVGEVAEPYEPGRGGSSAMPHKRNPVSSAVIVAAHEAALGHVTTLFSAMKAAQERPAGQWQAEWHSLPQLFGLASGALEQAVSLAKGLQVYPERMLRNLNETKGLLFAEAVAAILAPKLGRQKAHALIEEAAAKVRDTGASLQDVLASEPIAASTKDSPVAEAFSLAPHINAAAHWVESAVAASRAIRAKLTSNLEKQ
ncbi:MAG: adenylosuccinate lyase family protein [Rhodomicrobium sp.]